MKIVHAARSNSSRSLHLAAESAAPPEEDNPARSFIMTTTKRSLDEALGGGGRDLISVRGPR